MRIFNPKTIVHFIGSQKGDRGGYLWKRKSETKGSFKRRYFVVYGNVLAYYEKRLDKEPLGVLFLENHLVEMVDDLTMVIRFLTVKELPKGYYLRGDSAEDIEQWMRVLSRSGTDFFTLTLEDLEDQLRALNAVSRASTIAGVLGPADQRASPSPCLQPNKPPRRPNPFNTNSLSSTTVSPTTATTVPVAPSKLSGSMSTAARGPASVLTDDTQSTLSTESISSELAGLNPDTTNNLHWLLSQDWERLHAMVRTHLSDSSAHQSRASPIRQPSSS